MSFKKYLHLFSCTLIALGFSAIALSGAYTVFGCLGLASVLIYFKFHKFIDQRFQIPLFMVNGSILLLLAYSMYDTFFMSFDIVGNAVRFVIFLQFIKLYSPKTSRDWIQIYALSFLQLLASTVLSESIVFAIPFFIYLFVATWTLTLFNLKTQVEQLNENDANKDLKKLLSSKDVVKRGFFVSTAGLCSIILVFTFIVFFSIPRVSFKNFLKRAAKPKDVAGFSKEVDLGTLGDIQGSSEIAFRVEIKNKKLDEKQIAQLYWRANSADEFDGKTWRSSRNRFQVMRMNSSNSSVYAKRLPPVKKPEVMEYTVFLESLGTPLLFFADHFMEMHWDRSFLERFLRRSFVVRHYKESDSYEMHTRQRYTSDLQYTVKSSINTPSTEQLQNSTNVDYPEHIKDIYLQMPEFSEKLYTYFDSLSFPNSQPFVKTIMVQEYLKKQFSYSLNIQDIDQRNPLENFFLKKKAGHCEYFSTAMIMMLRYYGIPARQVMGFRGGEYNPYGNYLSVSQGDAHSWVEVYFPDFGWLRFDPTPGRRQNFSFSKSMLTPLAQFSDYIKIRWYRYIVDYNLKKQIGGLKTIMKQFSKIFASAKSLQNIGSEKTEDRPDNTEYNPQNAAPFLIFVAFIVFIAVLIRWLWKRTHKPSPYQAVLVKLKKLGFEKQASETPDELKQRVLEKHPKLQAELENINAYYYDYRFGKNSFLSGKWKALIKKLSS